MHEAETTVAVTGTALVLVPAADAIDGTGKVGTVGHPSARARWTKWQRDAFLDHFATTGDVGSAAARIGMIARDAYALRRRDTRFAAAWRVALDVGYDRLEAALIRQLSGRSRSQVNVGAAMLLLEQHRATRSPVETPRGAAKGDARVRAERELLRRLQAYDKRVARKAQA